MDRFWNVMDLNLKHDTYMIANLHKLKTNKNKIFQF